MKFMSTYVPIRPREAGRSKRYAIRAPLQYRIRGERVWHHGVSRNISESGILFEGDTPLGPGALFEVHLILKSAFGPERETAVRFHGIIVHSPQDGMWAARIFGRRLQRVEVSPSKSGILV